MGKMPLRGRYRDNVYVECGAYMEIHGFCKSRNETVVGQFDKEDFSKVDLFTWAAHYSPITKTYYFDSSLKGQNKRIVSIKLHRMLMGEPPNGFVVDHIDRNTVNNKKINLRIIPKKGNTQNVTAKRNSKSGIRGVSWYPKLKKWVVCLRVLGRTKHIGYFETIEEAEQAAIEARAKYMPYSQEALSQ